MVSIVQPKLPRVEFFPDKPGEPYRPCNGTEGEFFISMWCEECERDKVMNGQATHEDADKWKIRPGQRYRCVVFRDGRELVTQRARLDMDALCQRYDLYDDA